MSERFARQEKIESGSVDASDSAALAKQALALAVFDKNSPEQRSMRDQDKLVSSPSANKLPSLSFDHVSRDSSYSTEDQKIKLPYQNAPDPSLISGVEDALPESKALLAGMGVSAGDGEELPPVTWGVESLSWWNDNNAYSHNNGLAMAGIGNILRRKPDAGAIALNVKVRF